MKAELGDYTAIELLAMVLIAGGLTATGALAAARYLAPAQQFLLSLRPKNRLLRGRNDQTHGGYKIHRERIFTHRGHEIRIEIDGGGHIPRRFHLDAIPAWLKKRPIKTRRKAYLAELEFTRVETGDQNFDDVVLARGPETLVLSILGELSRREALRLIESWGGTIEAGRLRIQFPMERPPDVSLDGLLDHARRFSLENEEIPMRLAYNALHDPDSSVQCANMEALLSRFPETHEARQAMAEGIQDPNPRLRMLVARRMGTDGVPLIKEILQSPAFLAIDRAQALDHLAVMVSRTELLPLLDEAISSQRPALVTIALEHAMNLSHVDAMHAITDVLRMENEDVVIASCRYLRKLGSAKHQGLLIPLLQRPSFEVKTEVAKALGQIGTAPAVEPLHACEKMKGADGRFRRVINQSIANIQSRLVSGAGGGMSLVGEEEDKGALSVTDAPGRVSLPESG